MPLGLASFQGAQNQLFAVLNIAGIGEIADVELVFQTIIIGLLATCAFAHSDVGLTELVESAFGQPSAFQRGGKVCHHTEHAEDFQADEAVDTDQHILVILITTGVHDHEEVTEEWHWQWEFLIHSDFCFSDDCN
mgnify:CR=1 FL=1